MTYFFLKRWNEQLFFLKRSDLIPCKAATEITYMEITKENAEIVKELRGKDYYHQFLSQLVLGDYGLYACCDGKPVAYGWVKYGGSKDYFFNIGKNTCYLCRFFTHESARGQGIYPELISRLIAHEAWCDHFYIDIERGNQASQKGLEKVGFRFHKEYCFIRGFKHTFNKARIE